MRRHSEDADQWVVSLAWAALVMLVLLAIGGWLTRDKWLPKLTGRASTTASAESGWQPLSAEAGSRGKRKIDELSSSSGPVFANLTASEVASYVFQTRRRAPFPNPRTARRPP